MRVEMPPITIRYRDTARQWQAWFGGNPCVAYSAESSMQAVHRLLDGLGTQAGELELHIDHSGCNTIMTATWQPPNLNLLCEHCNGTGEYVGLFHRETCARCAGKGFVAV